MSNNPRLDKNTYESSKQYLEEALRHMAEAGHKIHDFSDFILEKFGDEFLPHLEHFYRDIREGRIRLQGMTKPVKTAFFGHHVTPEERERMIRETAYLRAEQRGFSGGSDYDDWLYAEKQIDEQLAQSTGLVARGRKSVSSAAALAEEELLSVKSAVTNWIEQRFKPLQKAAASKKKGPTTKTKQASATSEKPKTSAQKSGKTTAAVKKAGSSAKQSTAKKKVGTKKKALTKDSVTKKD